MRIARRLSSLQLRATGGGWGCSLVRSLFVAGAVILCVGMARQAQAQVATGKGRLNGIVMQQDGTPIAGATVVLTHTPTGDSWELTTNEDGRWIKGNMGRGSWNIDITAPGYSPSAQSVRVSEINRSKPVQTYLEAGVPAEGEGEGMLFGGELGERIGVGNELYSARDFQGALTVFEALLNEYGAQDNPNPNLYLMHINAGNAAFELDDHAKATEHFQAALAVDSTNTGARMGMATVFMMQRDLDSALAQLEQIDLSTISDPIVFYNIGSLLFEQGQSAPAQRYYELAIARDAGFADAHMQLALSLIQQGKMADAKAHLQKVIELDPESQDAALAQDFLNTIG